MPATRERRCLLMAPSDFPAINAMSEVDGRHVPSGWGMNLDYQTMDWGSMLTAHGQSGTRRKKVATTLYLHPTPPA